MKPTTIKQLINPFNRIAGWQALGYGLAGMAVSIVIFSYSQVHHTLLDYSLDYGSASNNQWWCFAAEHLIAWLTVAGTFYLSGVLLSKTKVRIIDMLGTVAFAQLPLILVGLFHMIPPIAAIIKIDPTQVSKEFVMQPSVLFFLIILAIGSIVFIAWTLIWLYHALKVSSNLKGKRLVFSYIACIVVSNILSRIIIGQLN